jgi:Phage integrase family
LSGLLPPSPAPPGSGCLLHPPAATGQAAKVSHLHSNLSASRRTHDLRHCAATFLKAAGADMKDIQETLGHSSITITGDTYTSVVHELDTERAKADAAAALVPRTSRRDHENPPPAALIQQALTARELLEPGQITLNGRGRPGHTGT